MCGEMCMRRCVPGREAVGVQLGVRQQLQRVRAALAARAARVLAARAAHVAAHTTRYTRHALTTLAARYTSKVD